MKSVMGSMKWKAISVVVTGLAVAGVASAQEERDPSGGAIPAQDGTEAVALSPDKYKVLLENDRVRMLDYHLEPGGKEPMHTHTRASVVYLLSDVKIKASTPEGKTTETMMKAGKAIWRGLVTHTGENTGGTQIHALIVECK